MNMVGAGLMVGTALAVIIPEGADAFYGAYHGTTFLWSPTSLPRKVRCEVPLPLEGHLPKSQEFEYCIEKKAFRSYPRD